MIKPEILYFKYCKMACLPTLMYKHRIGKHKDFNKVIYYVGMQSVIIIEGHDKFDGV